MAADFELDLLSFAISLYARSYFKKCRGIFSSANWVALRNWFSGGWGGREAGGERGKNVHEASFRRHISMNCLISDTSFGMLGEIESEDGVFELCRTPPRSRDFSIQKIGNKCGCGLSLTKRLADRNLRHIFVWRNTNVVLN